MEGGQRREEARGEGAGVDEGGAQVIHVIYSGSGRYDRQESVERRGRAPTGSARLFYGIFGGADDRLQVNSGEAGS